MPYQVIVPKGSAPPLAPYSPGAKADNVVYVSGTLALDGNGNLVGKGDPKAQTRHILAERRDVQSQLPVGHEQLWRHERGVPGIFPGEPAGPVLHPRRSGEAGVFGRDRLDCAHRGLNALTHRAADDEQQAGETVKRDGRPRRAGMARKIGIRSGASIRSPSSARSPSIYITGVCEITCQCGVTRATMARIIIELAIASPVSLDRLLDDTEQKRNGDTLGLA